MKNTRPLSASETATVLAALRLWQETANALDEFPEHFADAKPLDAEEIDALCEAINCGDLAVSV